MFEALLNGFHKVNIKRTSPKLPFQQGLQQELQQERFYLCSYPKCGRTWIRFIIANYLNLKYDLGLQIDFHTLFSVIPNYSQRYQVDPERGVEAYRYMDDSRIPLILASHSKFSTTEFQNGDILFVLRSVYDVMVSKFFHNTRQRDVTRQQVLYQDNIKSFIRDPNRGIISLINYLNSWAPQVEARRSLVITYESLYNHPKTTVDKILAFCNIDRDLNLQQEAIELASFESMQQIEVQGGIAGHNYNRNDPNARRVRRGKIGGYVDYLDKDDTRYIRQRCEATLTEASKRLLSKNGIEI